MSFYDELKRRNVLRVAVAYLAGSWLLIQILETLYPIFGLAETSIRVVVIVLGILFIPAVILAWIFEVTPQGIQLDADAKHAAKRDPAGRKALDRIIIATLTLALGFFALDKFLFDPARDKVREELVAEKARSDALIGSYGDNSIVVLPFINMSSDPEQEYFSDGIAEELLNLLAKIKELRVISRSSAFAFKGQDVQISTIAEKLKVAHVLEGSVRKAGNRVRITAQLIDARTDTHLWSETYDRELDDIFALQDEISAHVVEQLKITILGDLPTAEQIDSEAYGLYLRARHIVHSGQYDKLPLAEKLLNEALQIEPGYIRALSELGRVYLNYEIDDSRSEDDLRQMARDVVSKISAVEPDGITALSWRAWMAHEFDSDISTAIALYEYALTLEPRNLDLLRPLVGFLIELGYVDEAVATATYVVQRDPICVICLNGLSWAYRDAGEYDKAVKILRDAVAWSPDRQMIYWALGSALLQAGQPAEALAAFEKERFGNMGQFGRIMALHDLGRLQEFDDEFAELRANKDQHPEGIARIAAWTGNNDLALDSLEKVVELEGPDSLSELSSGFYVRLKIDPRFDELLRKHGQHPDQREKISFNFTPPE